MNEDVMVIPLRVTKDVGRRWKIEAVKQDRSVQSWLLEKMGYTKEDQRRNEISAVVGPKNKDLVDKLCGAVESKKTPPVTIPVPAKPVVDQKVMSAYVSAPVDK